MRQEQFYVRPQKERPDFRRVQAFLWGNEVDVDSDGDCRYVFDCTWTELWLCTRDAAQEMVDVHLHQRVPLILTVISSVPHLAARTAYLLAVSTEGEISRFATGPYHEASSLLPELGSAFSVAESWERFASSPFARSSKDNPYPNLNDITPKDAVHQDVGTIERGF